MRDPETIEDLLASAPFGSPEYHFYERLGKLVAALDLNFGDETDALALLVALEMLQVSFIDGSNLVEDDAVGGIEDIARVLAVFFGGVDRDPISWKARFPFAVADKSLAARSDELKHRVSQLSFVAEVFRLCERYRGATS